MQKQARLDFHVSPLSSACDAFLYFYRDLKYYFLPNSWDVASVKSMILNLFSCDPNLLKKSNVRNVATHVYFY